MDKDALRLASFTHSLQVGRRNFDPALANQAMVFLAINRDDAARLKVPFNQLDARS